MSVGRLWKGEGCFQVHDKVFVPLDVGSKRGIGSKRGNDHLQLERGIPHLIQPNSDNKDFVASLSSQEITVHWFYLQKHSDFRKETKKF